MLYIYTKNKVSNFNLINDVEAGFKLLRMRGELFEDDMSIKIMNIIDGITFKKGDYIESKFGSTSMINLSTGCKAVLLTYYYRNDYNILVNLAECGENAICLLFELSKNIDLMAYTTGVFKIYDDDAECFINGVKTISGIEILGRLRCLNG